MGKKYRDKEYRNVKKIDGSYPYYDAELWIDGKFIQHVTLSEVNYRYNVLMAKLESCVEFGIKLSKELLDEIDEVMQLKYEEGSNDAYEHCQWTEEL